MIRKFKRKQTLIEAEQYLIKEKLVKGMCNSVSCHNLRNSKPHVHTMHNNQLVTLEIGDWVIPESDGEHFYPCKPEIFEQTYEEVTE